MIATFSHFQISSITIPSSSQTTMPPRRSGRKATRARVPLPSSSRDPDANPTNPSSSQTTMAPRRRKRKATEELITVHPPRPSPSPGPDVDPNETDPSLINGPVRERVLKAMSNAWSIPQGFQMCILFDAVNPVRQFKRGTVFNEVGDDPFPEYDPEDHADLTESDEDGCSQPYKPDDYVYVQFVVSIMFLSLTHAMALAPDTFSTLHSNASRSWAGRSTNLLRSNTGGSRS